MADVAEALHARLVGYAGLAALVGTRVYSVVAPQDARLPQVRYQLFATERTSVHGDDTTPTQALFQVGIAAKTYASAQNVARQARTALKRWSGTEAGVAVQQVFLEGQSDGPWDDALEAYTIEQDYIVWFEEGP